MTMPKKATPMTAENNRAQVGNFHGKDRNRVTGCEREKKERRKLWFAKMDTFVGFFADRNQHATIRQRALFQR